MTVDGKQARRKNLTFRPKGENPLHDEAVRIMEQIGRGMCDLVAAAVVYYTYQLSVDNVEPEFAKLLNAHPSRTKVLVVKNPLNAASAAKPGIADMSSKNERFDDIAPTERQAPDESVEPREVRAIFSVPESEPQSPPSSMSMEVQGQLPAGLLDSLVLGFGKGRIRR